MSARTQMLQRRGHLGLVLFTVFTVLAMAAVGGMPLSAWYLAPFSAGSFAFTLRAIVMIRRAREQEQRGLDKRVEEKVRREQLHQELHTLKAPDADSGQCPVCSLGDLAELAAVDEYLEEPGSRFTRVVPYGAHRAHQECAELVPYKKTAEELALEAHELDHHGTPRTRVLGCPLCALETREQIATDPEIDQPIWPPLGVTMAELSERIARVFSVPPMIIGDPMQVSDLTERETRAMVAGLIGPDDWRRLGLRLPASSTEKDGSR